MVAESRFHRMLAESNKSLQNYKIDSVDLIKNDRLWSKFKTKQTEFQKAGKNSKTLMIFHGTPGQNIDTIVKENFTLSKISNGRFYGDGVYLSECPEISIKYSLGSNQLILCQVILGNSTKGKLGPGFDSSEVPNRGEERCFAIVIPDVDQIFPCYVINFSALVNHNTGCGRTNNQVQASNPQQKGPILRPQIMPAFKQAPATKLIAGHYRLRNENEFDDKLFGLKKERDSFATFLGKMGVPSEALKNYMNLTQLFIREEIQGGDTIYFHHANASNEQVCIEEIRPEICFDEESFQNGALYNCCWHRLGSSLGTTLFKQCATQNTWAKAYTVTREFTDTMMLTTYTEDVYQGFKCVLKYLKNS